jgi:nucleotide-binding universal stress UspA family protein
MSESKAGKQHVKLEQILFDTFTSELARQHESDRTITVRRVLFPTDFSPSSLHALRHAEAMARRFDAELLVLFVDFTPSIYDASQDDVPASKHALERAVEVLRSRSVHASGVYRRGAAADEIVRTAAAEQADLIIMSTHGRTGLTHALMGSVAESVVRRAVCPVMTVRGTAATTK